MEKKGRKKPTKARNDARNIVLTAIVDFLVRLALMILSKYL